MNALQRKDMATDTILANDSSGQYIRVRDGILDETANLKKHGSGKIPQEEPYDFRMEIEALIGLTSWPNR
jgi:hypothetical protein